MTTSTISIFPDFAENEGEAAARYQTHKALDPFPDIAPALLNSSDIGAYIRQTAMVFPFGKNTAQKPASIVIKLRGRVVYWDDHGKQIDYILSDEEIPAYPKRDFKYRRTFRLEKNSIAFVTLEPTFRLPDYIAARFNLTIQDVYRGLLLGTGPLVDPGYQGKLSIPLHNLTSNSYDFRVGDEIVWMEFTKVSFWPDWQPSLYNSANKSFPPDGRYHCRPQFPLSKLQRKDIKDYLAHACDGDDRMIASSIPVELARVEKDMRFVKRIGFSALIGAIVGVVALLFTAGQYHLSQIDRMQNEIDQLKASLSHRLDTTDK